MKEPFFITTAIDYTNGAPHIGHAYEKILADVLARFQRQEGRDVFFLTGVDQHGQKVQQSAEKAGVSPQGYVDQVTAKFRALWEKLGVRYDGWAATTDALHKECVRANLQILWDDKVPGTDRSRWIYKKTQRGFYSVRQEQFLTDKERGADGEFGPEWQPVEEREEENFYFRLTEHPDLGFDPKQWLLDFIDRRSAEAKPFVVPEFRVAELRNAVEKLEGDLCISRPAARLQWGIPFPESFGEGFVTYVWFDALVNYYSAVADRPGVWPAALHVIGKDILVPPHAVYWPIMLHAAGIELPRGLLAHGWWLTSGSKMSKSKGNAVGPLALVEEFGADALRFFLIREMNVGQDGDFSRELFLIRYNSDLANDLGNLVNRVLNMTNRFAGGAVPAADGGAEPEAEVRALWEATARDYIPLFEQHQFHTALERLFAFIRSINGYIEKRAPWKLGKSPEAADQALLRTSLATMAEALRLACVALRPVMPGSSERINSVLGYQPSGTWREELAWGGRLTGSKVAESLVLFPRPAPAGKAP